MTRTSSKRFLVASSKWLLTAAKASTEILWLKAEVIATKGLSLLRILDERVNHRE